MIGGPLKHALKTALLCAGGFLAETTRKFFMQFVVVHCSPSPASKLAVRHLIMFPDTKVTTTKGNESTSWWQCLDGKSGHVYEPPQYRITAQWLEIVCNRALSFVVCAEE